LANNDSKKRSNKGSRGISSSLDVLSKIGKLTTSMIFGTDEDFHKENNGDIELIKNTINKVNSQYKQNTGSDIIEFFSAVTNEVERNKAKDNKPGEVGKRIDINSLVENPQNGLINDIFFAEGERINLYQNYELLYDNIPQMAQALDTYVDNVMSPDDFTKNVFNVSYDSKNISDSNMEETQNLEVINKINNILDIYKIESKSKKIIKNSLKLGDQFVAVLKMEKELNSMLTESNNTEAKDLFMTEDGSLKDNKSYDLSVEKVVLESGEVSILEKLFAGNEVLKPASTLNESATPEDVTSYNESKQKFKKLTEQWKQNLSETINSNVEIEMDSSTLLENNYIAMQDFKRENDRLAQRGNKKAKETDDVTINGSVVKILESDRVIKLVMDDMVYGYYYIEKIDDKDFGKRLSKQGAFTNLSKGTDANEANLKHKLITDIFVKNLAKKIDKKFIAKNKDFKNVIYALLKQDYITDKKVKITYLAPNEVVHFKGDDETGDYGSSIYKSILFTAKIYLAVLTSTLMQKLVRSPEKRAFYIETDVDQDTEAAIQGFVRDIKTKDITMNSMKDITTIMSSVGTFHDMYIPVVDGNKPVEIDTIPGMDVDMDNEFLEYLLKTMISGLGIPPDFLSYSDAEFVRSLAMQNGKFVRRIIVLQKIFGDGFSELIQKLYVNEYGENIPNKTNVDKKVEVKEEDNLVNEAVDNKIKNLTIQIDKIRAEFPPPSSLNMTNMAEQINNSSDIIEFVVNTIIGESTEDAEILRDNLKRSVAKSLVPSIAWNKYEAMNNAAKVDETEIKLTASKEDDGY